MADYTAIAARTDGDGWIDVGLSSPDRILVSNLTVGSSLIVPSGTSFPGSPNDGDFFWRTDERVLYRYNLSITSWETTKPTELDTLENTGPTLYAPHGFTTWTESTINFVDGTLTFSITPVGGSYFYYYQGEKHTHTIADSVIITDTSGLWFIYYDNTDALTASTTPWDLFTEVPVATVYWNSGTAKGQLGEERHMVVMDPATHLYLHLTNGTRFENGLVLSGYTLDTDTDAAVTFGVSNGVIADEDIRISITHSATPTNPFEQILQDPAQIPVYHRTGAAGVYEKDTATDFWFKNTAAGRVNFNEYTGGSWQQTEATDGNFVAYWIFGNNHVSEPVFSIQGQREDSTLADAQDSNSLAGLDLGTLTSKENKILYCLILQTDDTFGGTRKAKLVDVIDLRTENAPGGTFIASSHASLGDLTSSGHPAVVVAADTTNFDKVLSASDTEVQTALETIDESRDVAQWNADRLQGNDVTTDSPTDGYVLVWSDSGTEYELVDPSTLVGADAAVVQARRSAALTITTAFVSITLDNTDVETDPTVVKHDDINTQQIDILQTGTYRITYSASFELVSAVSFDVNLDGQILKNGITLVTGSETRVGNHYSGSAAYSEDILIAQTFVANLTAGDYIVLQMKRTASASGSVNLTRDLLLTVQKISTIKGEKGDPGSGSTIETQDDDVTVEVNTEILNFEGFTVTDEGGGKVTVESATKGVTKTDFTEITVDTTTTSTSFTDLLSLSYTKLTDTSDLLIFVSCSASVDNNERYARFELQVDGSSKRGWAMQGIDSEGNTGGLVYKATGISSGARTIKVRWLVESDTGQVRPVATDYEHCSILVQEVEV